jgi:hypothetical protein
MLVSERNAALLGGLLFDTIDIVAYTEAGYRLTMGSKRQCGNISSQDCLSPVGLHLIYHLRVG